MAGLSNTLETKVLEWIFKQTAFGTAPTALYVSLHSADPGDTGASELSTGTGSYARAALAPDTNNSTNTNWNAVTSATGPNSISNKLAITFPTATADWNSGSAIKFASIWDASSAGNCLVSGIAVNGSTGTVVLNGVTLSFAAGSPGALVFTVE